MWQGGAISLTFRACVILLQQLVIQHVQEVEMVFMQ